MYEHSGKLFVALVVVLHVAAPATTHVIVDNNRIFGGSDAKDKDTGFMVGIIHGDYLACGGAIINKQTILTTALCGLYDISGVHAGTKNYSLDQGLTLGIKAVHRHLSYDSLNRDFDIALVRLKSPLNFSSTIRPIKLADSGEALEDDSSATLFGWGHTEFSEYSDKLLYKEVQIVNQEKCAQTNPITDRMLCGQTGYGVYFTDFGDPLVQGDKVIGIASHQRVEVLKSPVLYTRVAALRSWVDETLAENYNETL